MSSISSTVAGRLRQVHRLGDRAGQERLAGRHHPHVAHRGQRPRTHGGVEDLVVLGLQAGSVDDVAVLGDELDDRLDRLVLVPELAQRSRDRLVDDLHRAAAHELLYLTSEKSGSMPVVSQSIMKPIVPVGASTEACALRGDNLFFSPSLSTSAQAFVASLCTSVSLTCTGTDHVVGGLVLAHHPLVGIGVAGVAGVRADDTGQLCSSACRRRRSSAR